MGLSFPRLVIPVDALAAELPSLQFERPQCPRFVEALCRSARLSQATRRGDASDASGREHVSGRLVFRPVEEAWGFVRTPAGLVWPDASNKLGVCQEPGTW